VIALLKAMRENTKVILWIVVVGFLGFTFAVWGRGLTGGKGPQPGMVGAVNGERLSDRQFQDAYNSLYQSYRTRSGEEPDAEATRSLRDQAWDQLVQSTVVRQEAARRGLGVTDQEILYFIQNAPPSFLRNVPEFQTDDAFDPQKYQAALRNPQIDWTWLENYFRQNLPVMKLEEEVLSSVRVTDQEAEAAWRRQNENVRISYVRVDPRREDLADWEPTEADLRAYYDAHPDDFRVPEQARLRYVAFPKTPSPADTAGILEEVKAAQDELAQGEDFGELAKYYSDDEATASDGGNLDWFGRGAMPRKSRTRRSRWNRARSRIR